MPVTDLVDDVLAGNRRALARLLSAVENQRTGVQDALAQLFPHTGQAHVIGVTGAPGTGKSSLVNAMTKVYRTRERTVGIIAVDPTSPFSGGAILGDRIRMRDLSGDPGIFIRSMATRGRPGGLAQATRDAVRVMDAAGFDTVIVETVGAGQSEVDVVRTAHTTLVVEAPGLGDDVQAIKAGILEIADVLVVNKADRAGANQTERALKMMLDLGHPASREQFVTHHGQLLPVAEKMMVTTQESLWIPPVVRTVATRSEGIDDLLDVIEEHIKYLRANDHYLAIQAGYIESELYDRLQHALMQRVLESLPDKRVREMIQQVSNRKLDPQQAVEQLLADYDRR